MNLEDLAKMRAEASSIVDLLDRQFAKGERVPADPDMLAAALAVRKLACLLGLLLYQVELEKKTEV